MGMLEDALREYAAFEDRSTDPTTPSTGEGLVYFKNGKIHSIDDAGTVIEYGAGGSGGGGLSTSLSRAASLTVATATTTTVAMDTTDWDDGTWLSSGSLLLPAGTFLVTGMAEWGNITTSDFWFGRFGTANSVPANPLFYEGVGIRSDTVTGSMLIRVLAGGDTISLVVRQTSGSNRTLDRAALGAFQIA